MIRENFKRFEDCVRAHRQSHLLTAHPERCATSLIDSNFYFLTTSGDNSQWRHVEISQLGGDCMLFICVWFGIRIQTDFSMIDAPES